MHVLPEFCKGRDHLCIDAYNGESNSALPSHKMIPFHIFKSHMPHKKDEDHGRRLQIRSRAPFWIELVANAIGCLKNGTFSLLARKSLLEGVRLKMLRRVNGHLQWIGIVVVFMRQQ
jgi:hypothetical protein